MKQSVGDPRMLRKISNARPRVQSMVKGRVEFISSVPSGGHHSTSSYIKQYHFAGHGIVNEHGI